jgi:hypothetical protein
MVPFLSYSPVNRNGVSKALHLAASVQTKNGTGMASRCDAWNRHLDGIGPSVFEKSVACPPLTEEEKVTIDSLRTGDTIRTVRNECSGHASSSEGRIGGFGDKGLKQGQEFRSVYDLDQNQYHPTPKGIYYREGQPAQSILITNKYERDSYRSTDGVLFYEGSYSEPDNRALYKNLKEGVAVRVFVSHKATLDIAPKKGVRFAGMYRVTDVRSVSLPAPKKKETRPVFVLMEEK